MGKVTIEFSETGLKIEGSRHDIRDAAFALPLVQSEDGNKGFKKSA